MSSPQKAVAEEFDRYRDSYSDTVNQALIVPGMDVDYFTRVKAKMIVDFAKALPNRLESLDLIDVGCGVGNYHPLLKGRFRKLVGVDVSFESIAKAKEINPEIEYQVYDGLTLPYPDESFDIAYAICVVHHVPVPDWPNFFSELHRILKPAGHALIFEHNPYNPLTLRVVSRCPFDADAVLVKPGEARRLLRSAGFIRVSSRTFLSFPRFGTFSNSVDDLLGFLPFGAQYLAIGKKES